MLECDVSQNKKRRKRLNTIHEEEYDELELNFSVRERKNTEVAPRKTSFSSTTVLSSSANYSDSRRGSLDRDSSITAGEEKENMS